MSHRSDPIDLGEALARLEARWGRAAIRLASGDGPAPERATPRPDGPRVLTQGALAPVLEPLREEEPDPRPDPLAPLPAEIVSTGFPLLDAVLGTGGLPREASATLRGDASSGKTTVALRCVAEAQAQGAIVAWLDLTRALDPFEAVCRGVDLAWLVVLRTPDPGEGFDLAGTLLGGRAVDLLVVDLPTRLGARQPRTGDGQPRTGDGQPRTGGGGRRTEATLDDRLRRLAARARRSGARLIVLEPQGLPDRLHGALAESAGLRLELERRAWIRAGRDVVGQRTEVTVAKNRFGPPGRRAELEIHYIDA
jgi:recombination protein RecA